MPDMEQLLREHGLPLCRASRSSTPLAAFDVLGFTLQYDLCYSNVLTMLDLGGIPLAGRGSHDGPSAGRRRRAVRGQSRADVAVHRPVRARRRRGNAAGGVRLVAENKAAAGGRDAVAGGHAGRGLRDATTSAAL